MVLLMPSAAYGYGDRNSRGTTTWSAAHSESNPAASAACAQRSTCSLVAVGPNCGSESPTCMMPRAQ